MLMMCLDIKLLRDLMCFQGQVCFGDHRSMVKQTQ